jgi:hypothetical protein
MIGAEDHDPAVLLAYQAAFAAVADGRNWEAAQVLRDLGPEQLDELHVICGDVQTTTEAELRRHDPAVVATFQSTPAASRVDSDPRERQRIADIAALAVAEDIIYEQAVAAVARGDKDAALKLLRWCAPLGIGESPRLLANALEDMGKMAEARVWYARAARDGDASEESE